MNYRTNGSSILLTIHLSSKSKYLAYSQRFHYKTYQIYSTRSNITEFHISGIAQQQCIILCLLHHRLSVYPWFVRFPARPLLPSASPGSQEQR